MLGAPEWARGVVTLFCNKKLHILKCNFIENIGIFTQGCFLGRLFFLPLWRFSFPDETFFSPSVLDYLDLLFCTLQNCPEKTNNLTKAVKAPKPTHQKHKFGSPVMPNEAFGWDSLLQNVILVPGGGG